MNFDPYELFATTLIIQILKRFFSDDIKVRLQNKYTVHLSESPNYCIFFYFSEKITFFWIFSNIYNRICSYVYDRVVFFSLLYYNSTICFYLNFSRILIHRNTCFFCKFFSFSSIFLHLHFS